MDEERPELFRLTHTPCDCALPANRITQIAPTVFVRGACRDPARARLGLPDRTPLEKAVLRGTFNE